MKKFKSLIKRNQVIDEHYLLKDRALVSGSFKESTTQFKQHIYKEHIYVEVGQGEPLIFCYGLLGSFRNFESIANTLSENYRIIVPYLPMYDLPLKECTVQGLSIYLEQFIEDLNLKNCIVAGNSMGGGTVLRYTLRNLDNVEKIILFSSSGLSFIPMRKGFLKVKQYEYVKEMLKDIFYDEALGSEEEVQEIYDAVQSRETLIRCFSFTRSTRKDLLHDELKNIYQPVLIIWGKNDKVTPVNIASEFHNILPNSRLETLDQCGHCPPYEKPLLCSQLIHDFLMD